MSQANHQPHEVKPTTIKELEKRLATVEAQYRHCLAECHQTQETLKKSEERWQLLLQGTGDGIFDWNLVTGEAIMSSHLKQMLGYSDEMTNTYEAWRELLHPDDRERVLAAIQAHLEQQTPQYIVQYRLQCQDESYKWILAWGKAIWDASGQPIRMVGSQQDISDRKQSEAEIIRLNRELEQRVKSRTAQLVAANRFKNELIEREQDARSQIETTKAEIQLYRDVVENMQVGLCVWQLANLDDISSFQLVATNPAASQMLGITIEKCVGQKITDCFPNALSTSHQATIETYAEVVRSGQAQALGEVYYGDARVSGSTFAINAFPLPNDCVGVAFENITERKRTEAALAVSERQYRTVVNSVKEIIFLTDTDGDWTFLNPAWTDITGFEIAESLHTPFVDYIYAEEDQQRCAELFQGLMSGQQEFYRYEFRSLTKTGDFRWLEIEAQVYKADEIIVGTSGTINDTTERKQTEAVLQARADELTRMNAILLTTAAQLEKRNQELDQFAYVTSHDLKAPLRAIANLSEWIEEDIEDKLDDDTRHQMNLLRGRVHRMEALINGLLEYSRVGRLNAEPEMVSVDALLAEIIDSLAPPPQFTIVIKGEMPTFKTQRLPLQQVFTNLISNAIKHHNHSNGFIQISAKDQGKFYEFAVADDGLGIAPEYQEKVFVIFQTLQARDKSENTGIGLSIVKKIIDSQGGKIDLTSAPAQGATFRFTWSK